VYAGLTPQKFSRASGALLKRAIDTKVENFKKTGQYTHAVYDALVFRKVGGRGVTLLVMTPSTHHVY
jgi:hypothetical protein